MAARLVAAALLVETVLTVVIALQVPPMLSGRAARQPKVAAEVDRLEFLCIVGLAPGLELFW